MNSFRTPFLGAAYYPEAWDESEMEHDIAMMREAGITVVRMGEFAWSRMEPRPNEFHFGWLHRVVDRLEEAGISSFLCTPTATPPVWLPDAYPDVTVLDDAYVHTKHGGRRHCCTNHPKYYEHSMRVVREMAREFGDDPNVIGWQIDNEINVQECRCDHCMRRYHEYLEETYGSVEALNDAWNLELFSQRYERFDQIPYPDHGWHSAQAKLEMKRFQSKIQSEFVRAQVAILKEYTRAPIGTDTKPLNTLGHEDVTRDCDVIQYNHYPDVETLHLQRFWFDHMRTLKDRPFWVAETSPCWKGASSASQYLKPYGFCRISSWAPVILGGEATCYWLWRTHHAGHEMMHGAILSASGRPLHVFEEVRRISDEFRLTADFVNGTRVESETALLFTSLSWQLFETQAQLHGLLYQPTLYEHFYRPLNDAGVRPDVIGAEKDLSRYRVIFAPMVLSLESGDLPKRLSEWVKAGGILVAGPMTDLRSRIGTRYTDRMYGTLEELTGAIPRYEIPDANGLVRCAWRDGGAMQSSLWYELFDGGDDALATVTEGYPTLVGRSPLIVRTVGRGRVYQLGTFPSRTDMTRLVERVTDEAGIDRLAIEGDLIYARRTGDACAGLMVAECGGKTGAITLDAPMTDLLTGKRYEGRVELDPYELLVLRK